MRVGGAVEWEVLCECGSSRFRPRRTTAELHHTRYSHSVLIERVRVSIICDVYSDPSESLFSSASLVPSAGRDPTLHSGRLHIFTSALQQETRHVGRSADRCG